MEAKSPLTKFVRSSVRQSVKSFLPLNEETSSDDLKNMLYNKPAKDDEWRDSLTT